MTEDEIQSLGKELFLSEDDSRVSIQHTKLPDDADLSQQPKFKMTETSVGRLLEVTIKRLNDVELSYSSPRAEIISSSVKSNVPLSNADKTKTTDTVRLSQL